MNEKIEARIHSKNGEYDTVTIIAWNSNNDIVVEYNGKMCKAIANPFACCIYVDDIYGTL